MKRFLHIPLCAAALTAMLASCENTVEVIYMDENEPILVMNAMLEQDDSLHYVYVCLSEGAGVTAVTEAEVRCSVNGGTPIAARNTTNPQESDYSSLRTSAYVFEARFSPGDELRLTAAYKGMEAVATVTAPTSEASSRYMIDRRPLQF